MSDEINKDSDSIDGLRRNDYPNGADLFWIRLANGNFFGLDFGMLSRQDFHS